MGRLDGKVALITGGARGQGAAEGAIFAREGALVILTDILDEDGEKAAAQIGGSYLHHDVTSEEDWAHVVGETVDRHRRLDVLVNNAGIFRSGTTEGTPLDDYRLVIEINQVGVFLGMKAVAAQMKEQKGGSIINISSVAGLEGQAGTMAYTASKWAVRGMTKVAAAELGRHGVRVNSIHPGLIETPMMEELPAIQAGKIDRINRLILLGRPAQAEEVANLALFLASDEASYCTNSEFIVDGGVHR
jgi:3alpha(or 20beta)-hydroxysteroid dehydrogenase